MFQYSLLLEECLQWLQNRKEGIVRDFAIVDAIITYLSLTEKTNMRKAKIKRF
jgi:hypothetical protein